MFTLLTKRVTNENFDQNGEMSDPHLAVVRLSLTSRVYLFSHC